MIWTAAQREELRRLWADGMSASQIANEFGAVSRSAVMGQVHRSKLPPRQTRIGAAKSKPRPKKKTAKRAKKTVPARPKKYRPVPLMKLSPFTSEPGHCRWVVGEINGPHTLHCGAPKKPTEPYCADHMKLSRPQRSEAQAPPHRKNPIYSLHTGR